MNLVFDIGCNVGEFYSKCLQEYPGCKVVGVDANENLIKNAPTHPNLSLVHALVSNKDLEEVDFYIDHTQTGISSASLDFIKLSRFGKGSKYLKEGAGAWSPPTKVISVSLDSLVKTFGSPDYIKIDVEGYEYEVISGLSTKHKTICFEWTEENLDVLHKCVDHLLKLGYKEFGACGYFDEGNVFPHLTYDEHGDSYLKSPNEYHPWDELKAHLNECCVPERRVNYGMFFAI
jgi:FkbM family methyltransferase